MGLTHEALGERLRSAREARDLTQEAAASALGLSRPTLAQIEAGKRKVTGLELLKLAELYGRTMQDLLADDFRSDAEPVLMRALAEARSDPRIRAAINDALVLVRDILGLREMLGTNKTDPGLPTYSLPRLSSRWQAVEQGTRLAIDERQRLALGSSPLPKLGALLERQGVLILEMDLPEAVSGLTFRPNGSVVLAVNAGHNRLRQRFSLAHEYCHALCDSDSGRAVVGPDGKAIVCREAEDSELSEIRANVFAAAFLLPHDGVTEFLGDLGKGSPTRPVETIFSEGQPGPYQIAEGRLPPHSQDLGSLEVESVADYFGASNECTVWRLFNLKLLGEAQKDHLLAWAREARASDESRPEVFSSAQRMLVALAFEALRRQEISAGKFREFARKARLPEAEAQRLVKEAHWSPTGRPPS